MKQVGSERLYQNVIDLVRRNMEYYETHVDSPNDNMHALGCVMSLKEVLEHFQEEYEGHKLRCGDDLGCRCGLSQFTVTKVETLAHYECKCGNKWTDDEYSLATYFYCPACKKKIDGTPYAI